MDENSDYKPFECAFYYKGMTFEDYTYLLFILRHRNIEDRSRIVDCLMKKKLPPESIRTREDVFALFGADLNYVYDERKMLLEETD